MSKRPREKHGGKAAPTPSPDSPTQETPFESGKQGQIRKQEIQQRLRRLVGSRAANPDAIVLVVLGLFTAFLRVKSVRKILRKAFDEGLADQVLARLGHLDEELDFDVKADLVARAIRSLQTGAHPPGDVEFSEFVRRLQGSEVTVPDSTEIPDAIRLSWELFEAELTELLKDEKLRDKWIAYHGGRRVPDLVRDTKTSLLEACYKAGYRDAELFVACVEPEVYAGEKS